VHARWVEPVRGLDEDVERPLVGILGIGLAARVPPRDAQQRLDVLGDRLHDELEGDRERGAARTGGARSAVAIPISAALGQPLPVNPVLYAALAVSAAVMF
jgi:hypothetical protein